MAVGGTCRSRILEDPPSKCTQLQELQTERRGLCCLMASWQPYKMLQLQERGFTRGSSPPATTKNYSSIVVRSCLSFLGWVVKDKLSILVFLCQHKIGGGSFWAECVIASFEHSNTPLGNMHQKHSPASLISVAKTDQNGQHCDAKI
jgi:hypothetical protein